MTKIAICYGSRYGTTTSVVEEMTKVAEEAGAEVDAIVLKTHTLPVALYEYDLIIIGSGIQAGRWIKEPLEFIKENLGSLSKKKVALFVVCGDAGSPDKCDNAQTLYLDAISAEYPGLSPVSTGLFGGMFDFNKYNFVTRALVKKIVKKSLPEGEELPEIMDFRNWDQIRSWISGLL
ncbi:MAG: flavodoxin domain-containing protein [Candidatus Thorarchaeota archaeon]